MEVGESGEEGGVVKGVMGVVGGLEVEVVGEEVVE